MSHFRSRIFKPAASFIGLPELLPHDLRRTAATLQVGSGTPPKVVQERLGHADIRTTFNLYVQATGEAHTDAVRQMEETLNPPTPPLLTRKTWHNLTPTYDEITTKTYLGG